MKGAQYRRGRSSISLRVDEEVYRWLVEHREEHQTFNDLLREVLALEPDRFRSKVPGGPKRLGRPVGLRT